MKEEKDGLTLDFASIIASSVHDMKNSLTLLLDSLDEAVQTPQIADSPVQEKLQQAQHEGKRLNRNLIQLLALYRLERAQLFVNIGENSVSELLEDVAAENEPLLAARRLQLQIDCSDELIGFFDRELVAGVLNTVINNSYRYARSQIRLCGEERAGQLCIRVEDDGPGYPQKMLHGGGQSPAAIDFHTGSTGLGLYFAAQVAHLHRNGERHGYTETDNQGPAGGGRFSICLP